MNKRTAQNRRKPRGKVRIWLDSLLPKYNGKIWKYSELGNLQDKSAFMRAREEGYIQPEGVDGHSVQSWKIVYKP